MGYLCREDFIVLFDSMKIIEKSTCNLGSDVLGYTVDEKSKKERKISRR